ncbi:MAG TPA: hypothetical protein VGG75_13805 [Trebonia sp.]|jgi:hypothetical protein
MPDHVHADIIKAALSDYLNECAKDNQEPVAETYAWYQLMRERLHMDYSGLRRWDQEASEKKFNGQVLTQLNTAVRSGQLVKRKQYQNVLFYTPARAQEIDGAQATQEQAAEQALQRALTIRLRLEKLGTEPYQAGAGLTLSLDDWHRLVTLAENGTARRREG